jgi:hypothetical protein
MSAKIHDGRDILAVGYNKHCRVRAPNPALCVMLPAPASPTMIVQMTAYRFIGHSLSRWQLAASINQAR